MKKLLRKLCFVFLIAILVVGLASCNSPKSLAKQYYNVVHERYNTPDSNTTKHERLQKRLDDVQQKIRALSAEDYSIFEKEFDRLSN